MGRSSEREYLRDVAWGLRKVFTFWLFVLMALALLSSKIFYDDPDVALWIIVASIASTGAIIGIVMGLFRPQAEEGQYRGAAMIGAVAGAAWMTVLATVVTIFGNQPLGPLGAPIVVTFGALVGGAFAAYLRAVMEWLRQDYF